MKRELKCQNELFLKSHFSWSQSLCFYYWYYLTNFWHDNWRCRKTLLMFANVYLSKVVNFGYIAIRYLDFFFILTKINLGCNTWVGKNFQVSAILLLNSIHWQPEHHNWFQIISEGESLFSCTLVFSLWIKWLY